VGRLAILAAQTIAIAETVNAHAEALGLPEHAERLWRAAFTGQKTLHGYRRHQLWSAHRDTVLYFSPEVFIRYRLELFETSDPGGCCAVMKQIVEARWDGTILRTALDPV